MTVADATSTKHYQLPVLKCRQYSPMNIFVLVENVYENVGIDEWAKHCKEMHANSDIKFTEEYESICQSVSQDRTWKDSLEPANQPKNRYNNIVACECSIVGLMASNGRAGYTASQLSIFIINDAMNSKLLYRFS